MAKQQTKKAWRPACKRAMREATKQEALRRYGTEQPPFNYRWEHVKAVIPLALRLAELVGADVEVAEAAAWLHDVRKDAGRDHPQAGAAFARRFLPKTDFPAAKIEAVARAIADHQGLYLEEPLTNLDSQVLWDADKLAKLGLTAIFHWTGADLAKGKPQTTEDFLENGRLQDNDWLPKTVASMHTKPAQRAAQKRLQVYRALWDQLEAELRGDDLGEL